MRDERGEGRGRKTKKVESPETKVPDAAAPAPPAEVKAEAPAAAAKPAEPQPAAASSTPSATVGDKIGDTTVDTAKFDDFEQIEFILHQSTLGFHMLFDNADIRRVLSQPPPEGEFSSAENATKVQALLSGLLNSATLQEKRSYLESLPVNDHDLLVRAYFQLLDKTILAHVEVRH